jgi:hypothetical protein
VPFDKTKFVLHAGLAFGAFHHFIYAPYKASTRHGVGALVKAGLAGLFTVHELKLAKADAESSPTLCHLAAPFDKTSAAMKSSIGQIKSGQASGQDLEGLDNDVNALQRGAQANGVPCPTGFPATSSLPPAGVNRAAAADHVRVLYFALIHRRQGIARWWTPIPPGSEITDRPARQRLPSHPRRRGVEMRVGRHD